MQLYLQTAVMTMTIWRRWWGLLLVLLIKLFIARRPGLVWATPARHYSKKVYKKTERRKKNCRVSKEFVFVCSWEPDFPASEADLQDVDEQDRVQLQKQHVWPADGEGISGTQRRRMGSDHLCTIGCCRHWNGFGRCAIFAADVRMGGLALQTGPG